MRTGNHPHGLTLIEIMVSIGIIVLLGAILFPVIAFAREKGRQITCLNNQRQIAAMLIVYLQDNNDRLPSEDSVWKSVGLPATILICPDNADTPNGYAFNGLLAGIELGSRPLTTTMLTADGRTPNNIAFADVDLDERHSKKLIASFADGHVALSPAAGLLGGSQRSSAAGDRRQYSQLPAFR